MEPLHTWCGIYTQSSQTLPDHSRVSTRHDLAESPINDGAALLPVQKSYAAFRSAGLVYHGEAILANATAGRNASDETGLTFHLQSMLPNMPM